MGRMEPERRERWIDIGRVIALMLVAAAIGAVMLDFRLDDSFITYRYARNIAQGVGFVYNAGEPVLSVTNPLYTVLLAIGGLFTPNLPLLGNVLGAAAIGLGGWVMSALARPSGRFAAWGAGLFYVGFPLLWLALGMETPLYLLLGLLAVWLYGREKFNLAALTLGLATLARPDGLVLAVVLAVYDLLTRRRLPFAAGGVYLAALAPWILWATAYFGSPVPGTLAAKGAQAALGITGFAPGITFLGGLDLLALALLEQTWLWVAVGVVALYGLLAVYRERWALLLMAWGAWHLVGYVVLGTAPYRWYYAPLVPGLAALFGLGVEWLAGHLRAWRKALGVGLAMAFLVGASGWSLYLIDETPRREAAFLFTHGVEMLPTVDWDIYREAGEWLRENTPPEAQVGVAEVGQLGYWAERPMIDYLGLLQPDITHALARRDIYWWLPHTMPDYLVLSGAEGAALYGYSLAGDVWFNASYAEVARFEDDRYLRSPMVVYERIGERRPLTEAAFGVHIFPEGITLNRMLTDFSLNPLEESRVVRVCLEWYLEARVDAPQHVVVRILSRDGQVLAGQSDRTLDLSTWPLHRLVTTYHTFELMTALPPGAYDVAVGVGPTDGDLVWQPVALARIPLRETAAIGGLSGAQETLGEITLVGYRLARRDESLEVTLLWEAAEPPSADYVVFIHVLDGDGQIAAQMDSEPRGGSYPTTIWGVGERVPDTVELDLTGLAPGDYEVRVGLYRQGGERLQTEEGADNILIGRISITD
jgi:hypothetical protein